MGSDKQLQSWKAKVNFERPIKTNLFAHVLAFSSSESSYGKRAPASVHSARSLSTCCSQVNITLVEITLNIYGSILVLLRYWTVSCYETSPAWLTVPPGLGHGRVLAKPPSGTHRKANPSRQSNACIRVSGLASCLFEQFYQTMPTECPLTIPSHKVSQAI